jgi:outer membrane lipoprotein-sorting protein
MRFILPAAAVLALALAFAFAPPLSAQPVAAQATSSTDQPADIAHIETYLNGLTTAQADFTFVAPDGQISNGVFTLSRPSKLRFEYTEPKGNLMIADGDFVIYWDASQKEATNLPISQTPLAFLLRPHVSLTDGVRVAAYEHSAGIIRLKMVQDKDPGAGSVTFAFADQPLELRGWRLVDPQGQTTDVTFANWKLGVPVTAAMFHFDDPHQGKRGR